MSSEGSNSENDTIITELKENVVKFIKIDDMIRDKQNKIKELKDQRKPCEEFILQYLENINETIIEVSDGKIRKNQSNTKVPLNKDIIKEAIKSKVEDVSIVEDIINSMDELRPKKTRVNLKRTHNRKKI